MIQNGLVPRASVWLERRGVYLLGDAEAQLLEAIERTGSIKEAAKTVGLSYRTAWARVQNLEQALGTPAVESRAGGPRRGTSALTGDARELIQRHGDLRRRVVELLQRVAIPAS